MAWIYVFTAGLLEIGFAVSLKESHGFTRLWPTIAVVVIGGLSFFLLSLSLRTLPIGTAYAIWTGIGAAGAAIVGVVALGEPRDALKIVSISAIIAGVVGLRLAGVE